MPGAGPGVVSGPLKTSAGVSGRAPARFVNQLESGTSSTVLTFFARSAADGARPEQVGREIGEQIHLQRLHRRCVLRVALPPDRVVVVEARRGSGRGHRQRGGDTQRPADDGGESRSFLGAHKAPCHSGIEKSIQKLGLNENERPMPSRGAGQLDPGQRSVRRVQREADAVGLLQVPQIEVLEARGDLAGVDEQRHVDERTGGPAVLAAEEQPVAIAEAPGRIAAQRVAAAEIRHQEVRHVVSGGGVRRRGGGAKRDHPVLAQDRHELLHFGVDAAEAVAVAGLDVRDSRTSRRGRARRAWCTTGEVRQSNSANARLRR